MSTFRNPVGPQSASVYWKRRLILGLGLVAVLVIILLIVFRPGSSTDTPTDTHTTTAPKTPSGASTNPANVTACKPADIVLTPITDADSYNAEVNPLVSMSIENKGTAPCSINAGTDVQEYRVTSGADQIWSSKDCQADPAPSPIVLAPGVPQSTTPFPWDRTRSSTTTCTGDRKAVAAGGASYHLTVLLGDITSSDTKQFLLF
jgi:hypothetical protein